MSKSPLDYLLKKKISVNYLRIMFILTCFFGIQVLSLAQNKPLPYSEIGEYPQTYTPEAVVARMIDGLGFRYYWATESLRPEDLKFRPTPEARSSEETIDHIMGLSEWILKPIKGEILTRSGEEISKLPFALKRERTLWNLKEASDLLKTGGISIADLKINIKTGDKINSHPFWNEINGPIADALWHVGQVVAFRRSSGNPFDGKANVFMGKYMGTPAVETKK
jgi:hypothetical protein